MILYGEAETTDTWHVTTADLVQPDGKYPTLCGRTTIGPRVYSRPSHRQYTACQWCARALAKL